MRRIAIVAVTLCVAGLALGAKSDRWAIEEQWVEPVYEPRPFTKIIVVGISEDRNVRHRFEDKFVTLLRARGIGAVTSYPLAPDLRRGGNRQEILEYIEREGVDGAITVRLVPLEGRSPEDWAGDWRKGLEGSGDLRGLIEETLPLADLKSRRYGVEVALWEKERWDRIWAGRTGAHTRKALRKGASEIVGLVMDALEDRRLL